MNIAGLFQASALLMCSFFSFPVNGHDRVEDHSGLSNAEGSFWQDVDWSTDLDVIVESTAPFQSNDTAIYVTAFCKSASRSGKVKRCYMINAVPENSVSRLNLDKFLRRLRLQPSEVATLNRQDVELFINLRIADAAGTGRDEKKCLPPFCGKGWPVPPPPPPTPPPTPLP